jgi:ankyrin repeat protein
MRLTITLVISLSILAGFNEPDCFDIVRNGDSVRLSSLIKSPSDANRLSPSGVPLLMQAALHADASILKLLLDRGANPNKANPLGATALHWAAGDPAKVALLLAAGADPNAKSNLGRTPLLIAASTAGNAASLRLLLDKGADPKLVDSSGDGPMGNAASSGDPAMIRILIAAGANVNERGNRGPAMRELSPLMRASASGCLSCVKLLLAAGADVNAVSATPREIKAGLQDLGSLNALVLASFWDRTDIVKILLDAGAKIEASEHRGFTPLLMAASTEPQDTRLFDLLHRKGARLDVRSRDGESPADWVAKFGTQSPLASRITPGKLPARPEIVMPDATPSPQQAVSRSLNLLLSSNEIFFEKSGCPACHHQMLAGLLSAAASKHGIEHPSALASKQLATAITVTQAQRESTLQRLPGGGAPFTNSLMLLSFAVQNVPPSPLTDAMVHDIAGLQRLDGAWLGMMPRPPVQNSMFAETALAIEAIKSYASPGRRQEMQTRIARGKKWLETNKPPFLEDITMQALGIHWAGGKADHKLLLSLQQESGAWSQRPGLPADAYATGKALYTLAETGFPTSDPRFRRGIDWLLSTQAKDGSWYVPSRSVKFQPYFESGFPYGHDQWISATATAWAGLAIASSLPSNPSSW